MPEVPSWSRVPLADIVYFQEGPGIRTAQYRTRGVPFVNIRCFNEAQGRLDRSAMRCVDEAVAQRYGHFLLSGDDSVLSCSGSIGKVAWIHSSDLPCLLNTGVIRLRPRDDRLDARFLYYVLRSEVFQQQLRALAGGSVQKNLGPTHLRQTWIPLPALQEQRAIVAILSAIDTKADHCYRLYVLLRDWSQALFRTHCISSLRGEARLSEYYSLEIGGDWGKESEGAGRVKALCLRGVDLVHLASGATAAPPLRWITPTSIARRTPSARDVLIASTGAGPCGQSLWMDEALMAHFSYPVVYSNFCRRIRADSPQAAIYLDYLLADMRRSGEMQEYVNGTSVPNLDVRALLHGKRIAMPDADTLGNFARRVRPFYQRLYSREAACLLALRDLALSKLLAV